MSSAEIFTCMLRAKHYLVGRANELYVRIISIGLYEGKSINNQPFPFPMDRDGHDFHALFQYMIYTWYKITRVSSHSLIRY